MLNHAIQSRGSEGFRLNGKSMPYCKKETGQIQQKKKDRAKPTKKGDRKCIEK